MTIKQINNLKSGRLRALTGMTVKALGELLTTVLPELETRREQAKQQRPDRQRVVGGGAKRKLAPAQEVLLVLIYLRHNVAHEVVGAMFSVSADQRESIHRAKTSFTKSSRCCESYSRPIAVRRKSVIAGQAPR